MVESKIKNQKSKILKACFLLFFLLSSNSFALPKSTNFKSNPNSQTILKADQIDGDRITNEIVASGNVEVARDSSVVYADKVTYDKNGATIRAIGHVKVKNFEIANMFANEAEVKDDFSKGSFFDSRILFTDGSYLKASRIDREDEMNSTLYNPIFSICPNPEITADNDKAGKIRDFASLKASKMVVDRKEGKIRSKHSIFRIYNVPIFYTPYSSFAIPSKEKKSGFLTPSYFRNTIFGLGFRTPYYVNLAPNADLTVTPILYPSSNQFLVTNDLRHFTKYGQYKTQFEIANNNVTNTNNTTVVKRTSDKFRGSLISKGRLNFNHDWGGEFDINTLSDRDYMRDYHFTFWAYSLSTADLHHIKGRNYYNIKAVRIQELENTTYQNAAPLVMPSFESHVESKSIFGKEKFALTSNVTSIYRRDGLEYRRATAIPEVNIPFNLKGNLFAINSKMQTDLYWLEDNYKNTPQPQDHQSLQTNLKPEISASWRLPLIKKTPKNTLVIEPMANFVASTFRKGFNKLPNEDSSNSELSISNLFLSDRIYGYDRNEAGQRTSYGVKSSLFNRLGEFGLTAGQSYRLKNRDQDVAMRGFSDGDFSSYVGQAMFKAKKYFVLSYSFQFNQKNFSNEVNQVNAAFNAKDFTFSSDYLLMRPSQSNPAKREQISFNTLFKIGGLWKANLIATRDLISNRTLSRSVTLLRDGCCTVFSFTVMETNPINLTKPQRTFTFLLTFKNI